MKSWGVRSDNPIKVHRSFMRVNEIAQLPIPQFFMTAC